MKKNTKYLLVFVGFLTPAVALGALNGIRGLLVSFRGILNDVIPVLFGLSLIYFLWGVTQFILQAGDAKTRAEGKTKILWGIIALFVFVSIYGILGFLGDTLGIPTGYNSDNNVHNSAPMLTPQQGGWTSPNL